MAGPPPGGPPGRPPGLLLADVWPWLALLGLAGVAGILVWLFAVHDRGGSGTIVPSVVGLQQQPAVARLVGRGIDVKVIVGASSKPRGAVVSQSPGGGARIARDQPVTLHVSNGHALLQTTTAARTTTRATTTTQTTATVPSVTGQDMVSAAGQVEAAGFVAETDPTTSGGTAGNVAAQNPAALAQAPAGSVVRLAVVTGSSRPPAQIPDVVGQQAAAARARLLDATLTVRTIYKKSAAKNAGVVLAESPTGTQPAYTQITLTVGAS